MTGYEEDMLTDGKVDPTGDRPQRYRALLNTWRASVGMPPIEAGAE